MRKSCVFLQKRNISAREVIEKTREIDQRGISIYGIGALRGQQIIEAVDAAGFIFHESAESNRVRELLRAIFERTCWMTTEEYEQQEEFSRDQIADLSSVLREALAEREFKILCMRFGLSTEEPRTFREISKYYNLSNGRVGQIYHKAIWKLKRQREHAKNIARIFPNFSELPEAMKIALEPERYRHMLDQLPIKSLGLSIGTYGALSQAGFVYTSELVPLTMEDLMNIHDIGEGNATKIFNTVSAFHASPEVLRSSGAVSSINIRKFLQAIFSCEVEHITHACSNEQILLVLKLLNDLLTPVEEMTIKALFGFKSDEPLTEEQTKTLFGSGYDSHAKENALAKFRQPEILRELARAFPEFSEFLEKAEEIPE